MRLHPYIARRLPSATRHHRLADNLSGSTIGNPNFELQALKLVVVGAHPPKSVVIAVSF
jgi:hypothetical protein